MGRTARLKAHVLPLKRLLKAWSTIRHDEHSQPRLWSYDLRALYKSIIINIIIKTFWRESGFNVGMARVTLRCGIPLVELVGNYIGNPGCQRGFQLVSNSFETFLGCQLVANLISPLVVIDLSGSQLVWWVGNLLDKWNVENDQACNKFPTSLQF